MMPLEVTEGTYLYILIPVLLVFVMFLPLWLGTILGMMTPALAVVASVIPNAVDVHGFIPILVLYLKVSG